MSMERVSAGSVEGSRMGQGGAMDWAGRGNISSYVESNDSVRRLEQ